MCILQICKVSKGLILRLFLGQANKLHLERDYIVGLLPKYELLALLLLHLLQLFDRVLHLDGLRRLLVLNSAQEGHELLNYHLLKRRVQSEVVDLEDLVWGGARAQKWVQIG